MGELVETAKALSAPATKLVEVVSRGIGRAYDPRYKRKMADAAAYEIDTIAGAIRRNGDVPILFDREGIQLDARSAQELAERAQMRLFSQEMYKQQNIEAIVDTAYEELSNESSVSDEPVGDDWIVRFFNSVEDVSNEIVQNIWSKVLVGEIKRPSSISLRTLETLKNLSQYETELFQRYSNFVMRSKDIFFLPSESELDVEYAITDRDIKRLDDAGLVNGQGQGLMLSMKDHPRNIRNEQIIGLFDILADPNVTPTLTSYFLTHAGGEIYEAIRSVNTESEAYAIKYLRLLKHKQNHLKISAHRISEINGDHVRYEDGDLI